MRFHYSIFLLLLSNGLLFLSCSLDDEQPDFRFVNLTTIAAELPASFQLNKTYNIKVTYLIPDSCTQFEGFDITQQGTGVRNVVTIGAAYEDLTCTTQVTEEAANFDFICLYDTTYRFRFWTGTTASGEATYIEYEVPVE